MLAKQNCRLHKKVEQKILFFAKTSAEENEVLNLYVVYKNLVFCDNGTPPCVVIKKNKKISKHTSQQEILLDDQLNARIKISWSIETSGPIFRT